MIFKFIHHIGGHIMTLKEFMDDIKWKESTIQPEDIEVLFTCKSSDGKQLTKLRYDGGVYFSFSKRVLHLGFIETDDIQQIES
jgi:hypothetical protein